MNEIMSNTNYGIPVWAAIVSAILAIFDFFLKGGQFSLFSFVINFLIFFIIFKVLQKYNYFDQSCAKPEKNKKKGNKK